MKSPAALSSLMYAIGGARSQAEKTGGLKTWALSGHGRWTAMRFGLVTLATVMALPGGASADTPQQCTAQWDRMVKSGQTGVLSYRQFTASCLANRAPPVLPLISAPANAPPDATARCRDGAYTSTTVRLAACEHHGGVAALVQ